MDALSALQWIFDALLGVGLLWLAWRALASSDLFEAIVVFIAFGLMMALAWGRLGATDVALAEAGIGAGLTGALLLRALAKLRKSEAIPLSQEQRGDGRAGNGLMRWAPFFVVSSVAMGLGYVVVSLPLNAAGLGAEIGANLEDSGVSNPVTAVLLNFRGYDTLLEMVVLLVALLGVWSVGGEASHRGTIPGPVLDTLSRLLMPVLLMVAAYLLWAGAHAPGGAFQAGSVLGAAGVLSLLTGWRLRADLTGWPLRLALALGAGVFIALAIVTLLFERQLLEYPRAHAGVLILVLEAAATLSIGATLAALFLGHLPNSEDIK